MECSKIVIFICLGLGVFFFIGGAIVGGLWYRICDYILSSQMVLSSSSQSFDLWKDAPIPIFFDVYFFNWTNPEDTLKNRAKPHFSEVGPYVYRMRMVKVDLHWNTNGTVTFRQFREWHFVPEQSHGSLDDEITNINVIAMTIGALAKKYAKPWQLPIIDTLIHHEEKVYITRTARELLFDGYEDKFLSLAKELKPYLKIDIPFDKFGWFYSRNMSTDFDGVFNMYTGSDKVSDIGHLYSWNYYSRTNAYLHSCGDISGSTGELWPIHSAEKNEIEIFASDICSSIKLNRGVSESTLGLKGYRFVADGNNFNNRTSDNKTSCYCVQKQCQPSGTRDISACRFGVPGFLSFPHFYQADPIYREYVSGMSPKESEHEFYMVLEEKSSIPVQAHAKMQLNILVEPIEGLRFYKHLPYAFLPQVWFHQRAEITKDLTAQIKPLMILYNVGQPLFFSICGIGALLILVGVLLWLRYNRRHPPKVLLIDNSR